MIIQSEYLHVELKRGSLLEIADAPGNRLTCLTGTLWITQHHQCSDWVLQAGQSLRMASPGKVVISACNGDASLLWNAAAAALPTIDTLGMMPSHARQP